MTHSQYKKFNKESRNKNITPIPTVSKFSLSTYFVPSTVLETEDLAVNKPSKFSCLGAYILEGHKSYLTLG